ncbi:protein FAM133 isoform X2 [Jatropha curcas]|uniref:protein FAM133 isoform X2 n=1 Tax=Jatropha curcas TaxID=180498 RepID=UPI0009D78DE2|nr:protein FAM133 isoform X2 [Jatropha curcas]
MRNLKEKLEKKKKKKAERTNTEQFQKELMLKKEEKGNGNIKPIGKEKRKREKEKNVDTGKAVLIKKDELIKAQGEKDKNKPRKKKRKDEQKNNALVGKSDQNDDVAAEQSPFKSQGDINNFKGQSEAVIEGKSKKSKKKKKEHHTRKDGETITKEIEDAVQDEVFYISSGEEDCSKGMRKWLMEYHQSRPGLKVLQESIDQFITAHEEKLEQERKEREARAAEDGWTVVVHHKGRKKTTDSESGVTVGSVAPTVAESQLAKKKQKEVGPNFYRFQKRETQRNEILALQSKFEQDRKRIQQLRAARKFRPY